MVDGREIKTVLWYENQCSSDVTSGGKGDLCTEFLNNVAQPVWWKAIETVLS
jgi:hypothetical protein